MLSTMRMRTLKYGVGIRTAFVGDEAATSKKPEACCLSPSPLCQSMERSPNEQPTAMSIKSESERHESIQSLRGLPLISRCPIHCAKRAASDLCQSRYLHAEYTRPEAAWPKMAVLQVAVLRRQSSLSLHQHTWAPKTPDEGV